MLSRYLRPHERKIKRERKIMRLLQCSAGTARIICGVLDSHGEKVLDEDKIVDESKNRLYMRAAAEEIYFLIKRLFFSEIRYGVGAHGVQTQILEVVKKYKEEHR